MKRVLAALLVTTAFAPIVLGVVAVFLMERSIPVAIGGGLTAALFFLPLTALGLGLLPLVLHPDTDFGRDLRRPGAVAFYVVLQMVFLVLAIPALGSRGLTMVPGILRSDLKNLAGYQDLYLSENGRYSESFAAVGFVSTTGVSVDMEASSAGWSASAIHEGSEEVSCALFAGQVPAPLPTRDGNVPTREVEVICDPIYHLNGMGRLGDALRTYHRALDHGIFNLSFF